MSSLKTEQEDILKALEDDLPDDEERLANKALVELLTCDEDLEKVLARMQSLLNFLKGVGDGIDSCIPLEYNNEGFNRKLVRGVVISMMEHLLTKKDERTQWNYLFKPQDGRADILKGYLLGEIIKHLVKDDDVVFYEISWDYFPEEIQTIIRNLWDIFKKEWNAYRDSIEKIHNA